MEKETEDNIDFVNLVLMLNQNTLIALGEAPRYISGTKKSNLPNARQTINMIKAIKDKCTNMTPGETKLIFRILGDLQKKYVIAAGLMTEDGNAKQSPATEEPLGKGLDKLSTDQMSNLLSQLQKKSNAGD